MASPCPAYSAVTGGNLPPGGRGWWLAGGLAASPPALAHGGGAATLISSLAYLLLLLAAVLYGRGRRSPRPRRDLPFALGWLALALALSPLLEALAGSSFAWHMIQHEILLLVAAPLWVLARPGAAWLRAAPVAWRRPLVGAARPLLMRLRGLTHPVAAWLVHALTVWIWHAPPLFERALANPWLHAVEHLSFFGSAWLYWHALLKDPNPARPILSLFATATNTAVLGALLTYAGAPWYASYSRPNVDALADQQLGGLIMWVPGGVIWMLAALWFTAVLLTPASTAPGLPACRPRRRG